MTFQVFLTDDASGDLEELYDYVASHDAPEKADYLLEQIDRAFSTLCDNPERGAYPKELLAIGLREYREIFWGPYRSIYRVMTGNVYVMVIADGRRDMQTLLQRRFLRG